MNSLPFTQRLAAHLSKRFVPVMYRDPFVGCTRCRVFFRLFNSYWHVSDWYLSKNQMDDGKAGDCSLLFTQSKAGPGARRMTAIAERLHDQFIARH